MSEQGQRVLVLAPYYTPAVRAGGPVRTLVALVAAAPGGTAVDVVTRHSDHGGPLPVSVPAGSWVPGEGHRVLYLPPSAWAAARSAVAHDSDLVYLNSFFDVAYSVLPQVALAVLRRSRTVLLAPRGELSPGALAHSPRKKRLMIALYRGLALHRRVVWHASGDREAEEIREVLGARIRVVVRENETRLPAVADPPPVRRDGVLRGVFFSRLVPKKGLHVLLEALAHVTSPLELDVYGSEEDPEYVRRCRALAASSGKQVVFHGAVDPDEAREHLVGADVMFFPTDSENFGHVIAEALSVSCPVVLPDTTPWTEAIRRGGGTVVESNDRRAWASVVEAWAELTPEARADRRAQAAAAYSEWRAAPRPPHVFVQVRDRVEPTRE